MTYEEALLYDGLSEQAAADHIAWSKMALDPEIQRIKDEIKQYEETIKQLELEIGKRKVMMSRKCLPEALSKKEEAKKIMEMHKKLELEFRRKLRSGEAF